MWLVAELPFYDDCDDEAVMSCIPDGDENENGALIIYAAVDCKDPSLIVDIKIKTKVFWSLMLRDER